MNNSWSIAENETITADYFDMLGKELRGELYSKTEHRNALMDKISRSKGSIEFKHQNVSAVLAVLGLPYIQGYKPRRNFQVSLAHAVSDVIGDRPGLYDSLAGTDAPDVPAFQEPEPLIPIEGPPTEHDNFAPDAVEGVFRIFKQFERPEARDARNRELGEAGEKAVLLHERHRLHELGRPDLSERVEWTAKERGDGFGFDVRSFFGSGAMAERELMLEVKTTGGPKSTPFYITKNELHVASEQKGNYRLVRLYNFRFEERRAAYELLPPLERSVNLQPTIYRARPAFLKETASHA